jgi:hypothetical protein
LEPREPPTLELPVEPVEIPQLPIRTSRPQLQREDRGATLTPQVLQELQLLEQPVMLVPRHSLEVQELLVVLPLVMVGVEADLLLVQQQVVMRVQHQPQQLVVLVVLLQLMESLAGKEVMVWLQVLDLRAILELQVAEVAEVADPQVVLQTTEPVVPVERVKLRLHGHPLHLRELPCRSLTAAHLITSC